MNIEKYEELTGKTVSDSKRASLMYSLRKTQKILESMLGYTLDSTLYDTNYYTETGKTSDEFPHPDDQLTLTAADPVIGAYRLYNFNYKDAFYIIDPASEIHAVKIVRDGITYATLETDEYAPVFDRGITKALQQNYFIFDDGYEPWFFQHYKDNQHGFQLAVDATWLWDDVENMPEDLLYVWVEMADYYTDKNRDIKSQTLGSHSYTRFDNTAPQMKPENMQVIKRYAGAYGTIEIDPII